MRDFDPHRTASEWHSGQGSALYAYASTGRIPSEDFKDRLVWEIERSMARADDDTLDELEYLLMNVEEQSPERHSGVGMREGIGQVVGKAAKWGAANAAREFKKGVKNAQVVGKTLATGGGVKDLQKAVKKGQLKPIGADFDDVRESDAAVCSECGSMKVEGTCECAMNEAEKEPSTYDYDDEEMSLDQKRSAAAERSRRDARRPVDEARSTLSAAIAMIVKEMKLSVAGRGHFDFGGGEEADSDHIADLLLLRKDAPAAPESKVKAKPKQASKRKSKKTA